MKRIHIAAVILPLAFSGCAQVQQAESNICSTVTALPPFVVATLDVQDTHSVIGSLWAYQKSACVGALSAPGVSISWGSMLWGELKVLIPQMLPQLLPMLVGFL